MLRPGDRSRWTNVKEKPELDSKMVQTSFIQKLLQQGDRDFTLELGSIPDTAWTIGDLLPRSRVVGSLDGKLLREACWGGRLGGFL